MRRHSFSVAVASLCLRSSVTFAIPVRFGDVIRSVVTAPLLPDRSAVFRRLCQTTDTMSERPCITLGIAEFYLELSRISNHLQSRNQKKEARVEKSSVD